MLVGWPQVVAVGNEREGFLRQMVYKTWSLMILGREEGGRRR